MVEGMNNMFVALIPNVNNPHTVDQFRLISLWDVCYKVITKALTNRINPVL